MSFPKYPQYKDSGVEWLGSVPAHWSMAPFKRLVDIQNGADHKDIEQEAGYPVIGSGGAFAFASDYMYDGESVLLGRKGTIDKPLFVTGRFWTVDTMYWTKVAPDANARFAYYTALTIPFDYYSTNTALPSMTKGILHAHLVAYPPRPEQDAIAVFLDRETAKIDALVEEQKRLIELLKEKRQAVISQAVTKGLDPNVPMKDSGVEWLGEVPAHWAVRTIGTLATVVRGASPRPAGDPTLFDGDHIPWVTVGEITKDDSVELTATNTCLTALGAERSRLFRSGTLLYSNSGATLGVPKVLCVDACANDGVVGFENLSELVSLMFLYRYLGSLTQTVREMVKQGAGQPNLNTDLVKNFVIALPPLMEQKSIGEHIDGIVSHFDQLSAEASLAMDLLTERRSALISAAVTGKIDVRGLAPQPEGAAA